MIENSEDLIKYVQGTFPEKAKGPNSPFGMGDSLEDIAIKVGIMVASTAGAVGISYIVNAVTPYLQ